MERRSWDEGEGKEEKGRQGGEERRRIEKGKEGERRGKRVAIFFS